MSKLLVLSVLLISTVAHATEPGVVLKQTAQRPEYAKLIADRGAAVVTVKAVLQIKSGGGGGSDRASEVEVPGVVIDATGLVLCSNTMLGGFMPRFGGSGPGVSVVPSDLKVLFGTDTDGVDARLLARDSELDLAWVQIKSLGDRKLTVIDVTHAVPPVIGDDLLSLHRMGKQYARVPVIMEGRLAGVTQKPRSLLLMTGDRAPGVPIFLPNGQLVGISALQVSDDDDRGGRGGARNLGQPRFGTIVLPGAEIAKATVRAKEPADTEQQ